MFTIEKSNIIRLTRGDYMVFDITLKDASGEIYELKDGEKITFTVKRSTMSEEILIQKTGAHIEIFGSDTENLSYGQYIYDCQFTDAEGRNDTFIAPTPFIIMEEVTWNVKD